jgi:predicted nucleic acid-binding Zn ribbon protein
VSRFAWRQPVRIAEAIPSAFQRLGLEGRFRQGKIWAVWPAVVGQQIARRAQPHGLWQGRLIIHVTDPVWLHHLSMMRHRVMAALNEKLGGSVVRDLVLRIGEVPAMPVHPAASSRGVQAPPPDPALYARVEGLMAPLGDVPFREALCQLLLRALRPT